PIGKKRFGNEKPEFSTFSWVGMIFTAVAGFGVLTWTSIEWFYYAQAPTWGIEPFSAEALEWASMYPLFHWGPVAFAIATLMGVFFAYQFFCKKIEDVRPSTTCIPVLGEKLARGPLGKIFDALFSIGLLCSVVTCVGVNVPTLFGIISRVFGSEPSFMAQAGVIMGWSVLMSILLFTGLKKGIRFFSDFRVWVGFGILAFLLVFGPTATLLNNFVDSVGMFIQYGSRLILNTDPTIRHTPSLDSFLLVLVYCVGYSNRYFLCKSFQRSHGSPISYRCLIGTNHWLLAFLWGFPKFYHGYFC
ncbi:MAG: BCCT family transporter, partial [Clostridiales bacterium]